jgi:hypothetical protein
LGLASGSAATMRVVGQIASMTIATIFFAILFQKQSVEVVSNVIFLKALRMGFITSAIIAVTGIYFSFSRGRITRES